MPRIDRILDPEDPSGATLADVMRSLDVAVQENASLLRSYIGLVEEKQERRQRLMRHRARCEPIRKWAETTESLSPGQRVRVLEFCREAAVTAEFVREMIPWATGEDAASMSREEFPDTFSDALEYLVQNKV